ncbi:MAG: hypothetical protein KDC53_05085 [Saprospiraceae bacterium]|nr:hypothetical protein [Saprospiraceae bacterium]
MRTLILPLLLVWLPFLCWSQGQIFGSWQGKMSTPRGNYIFNLDLQPGKSGRGYIRGVAIHDRNGEKQVIELEGYFYGDQSLYLADVADPLEKVQQGNTFSRLQFLCKYEGGEMILSGHWQEYEDLRKYRRGRLLLHRKKTKA